MSVASNLRRGPDKYIKTSHGYFLAGRTCEPRILYFWSPEARGLVSRFVKCQRTLWQKTALFAVKFETICLYEVARSGTRTTDFVGTNFIPVSLQY